MYYYFGFNKIRKQLLKLHDFFPCPVFLKAEY